jgi:hypothetical protein
MSAATARPPVFTWRRLLIIAFWAWWAVSAIFMMRGPDKWRSLPPIFLGLVWAAAWYWRKPLGTAVRAVKAPLWLKFFLLGISFFDIIMESFAVSFQGDLNRNIVLSNFLWLGSAIGIIGAWWIVAHLYAFTPWQVFFLYGLKGTLIEQDYLVPLLFWKGQWATGLILIPFLIVVYGSAIAPVFALLERALPKDRRIPGGLAVVTAILLPAILFYGGAFLWFRFCAAVIGLKTEGVN